MFQAPCNNSHQTSEYLICVKQIVRSTKYGSYSRRSHIKRYKLTPKMIDCAIWHFPTLVTDTFLMFKPITSLNSTSNKVGSSTPSTGIALCNFESHFRPSGRRSKLQQSQQTVFPLRSRVFNVRTTATAWYHYSLR